VILAIVFLKIKTKFNCRMVQKKPFPRNTLGTLFSPIGTLVRSEKSVEGRSAVRSDVGSGLNGNAQWSVTGIEII
jgi:hypothetical protein